ncbi:MAG: TRAM domain-containing protein [Dermatophilaceae bacterium]
MNDDVVNGDVVNGDVVNDDVLNDDVVSSNVVDADRSAGSSRVGEDLEVTVTSVAHGGHCVARHDALVVFVRHALPGERVRARVTSGKSGDRYVFADAVEILHASPHRVEAPCRYAGPGGCGGCDFQHVEMPQQRELKRQVLVDQLTRLGGLRPELAEGLTVQPLPGHEDGLGWRSRMEFAVDRAGRTGLRPHRSRAVLPLEDCLIAVPEIRESGVLARRFPGARSVHAVATSTGERAVVAAPQGLRRTPTIHEVVRIGGRDVTFRLNALGFWQVHPAAVESFTAAVLAGLDPQPGEHCLDLYAGVGVFARALADAVGPTGHVLAVESDARACRAATEHFADDPHVEVVQARVDRALDELGRPGHQAGTVDLVVLDPPRAGAGRDVVQRLAVLRPRAIAYVACDPATLGRDLALAEAHGYEVAQLSAYDAFPMTHHMETIAILRATRD